MTGISFTGFDYVSSPYFQNLQKNNSATDKQSTNNTAEDAVVFSEQLKELMEETANDKVSSSTASNDGDTSTHFDFTNMTRKEAIDAAMYLFNKGEINQDAMSGILGAALDYLPMNGGPGPLDNPEKIDFIKQITQILEFSRATNNVIGIESYEVALNLLTNNKFESDSKA